MSELERLKTDEHYHRSGAVIYHQHTYNSSGNDKQNRLTLAWKWDLPGNKELILSEFNNGHWLDNPLAIAIYEAEGGRREKIARATKTPARKSKSA